MTDTAADFRPTAPNSQDAEWKNLLGVCAALGEDFGVNPLWFRLTFATTLILNPVLVIGAYFAIGAIVLLSRLAMPNRKPSATVTALPVADRAADELKLAA